LDFFASRVAGLLHSAQVTQRKRQYKDPEGQLFRGARKTIAKMFYVAGRGIRRSSDFNEKIENGLPLEPFLQMLV
jgi:hypothetical protein